MVIPAYDAARYLGEAIESVLFQGPRLEVLVVDDGSRDATATVAEAFGPPVRCLRQANAGIGAARNRGARAARGEALAFLDADDLWPPGKLVRQLELLGRPGVELVLGQCEQFVSPELPPEVAARLRCPPGTLPAFLAGGLLLRRRVFERVGPFDEDLRAGEFVEWFGRARALGLEVVVPPDLVLRRRLHETNHGVAQREVYAGEYLRLVRDHLRRRRQGG